MKGERLRVAWLGHRSQALGASAAIYSQDTVRALRSRDVDVTFFRAVVSATHPAQGGEPDEEVMLASLPLLRPLVFSPPAARRALLERLRRGDFDLVHASFWYSSLDFELPALCREVGLPLIATFHVGFDLKLPVRSGLTWATYRLYARSLRECERVIVFGEGQARLLGELGVPARKIEILPSGVDVHSYSPGPSGAKRALGARHLFVYGGRLGSDENLDVLIRAFLGTVSESTAKLLVIGTGPDRRRLERAFPDQRISFAGPVNDEAERIGYLRAADAFLLPTATDVLSHSLLEAMACGAPCVAADYGSNGEALRGAGLVLDPLRLEGELRLAIRTLADTPVLRRRLRTAARQRALDRYSLDENADRLLALYRQVAA